MGLDPPSDLDLEMVARFRVAIARVGRQLRQQAGAGLSPTLHSMLVTIAIHGPLSLSELAAREQVAPPTVTKVLAKLDEQGLVAKERGPSDRRVTLVSLTEAGAARLEESRTRRTAWLVQRLVELGACDRKRLTDAVELLEAIVQADIDDLDDSDRQSDRSS
jgi:DNA-binding MarR family transcriptional regulator